MRHAHQRRAPVRQVLGEPGDALDVEVVGGLVQDDQVLLLDEQLGERDPAPLATGQRTDDGVQPLREARQVQPAEQPGQYVPDLGVPGPLVVRHVADDLVAHGGLGVEGIVLGEHADPQPAGVRDPSGVGLLQLGEHPDEGGLAVAVASDDPDPVPFLHTERDTVQQGTGAVHLADVLDIDQVDGHFTPVRGAVSTCGSAAWVSLLA